MEGGRPFIVSHFPSKKQQKRRRALRTSTEMSCPSPVRALQSAATPMALAAKPMAAMLPKRMGLGTIRYLAIKRELSATVRGRHSDIAQHVIYPSVEIKLGRADRVSESRLESLGQ